MTGLEESYSQVAQEYVEFYNTDLYSVYEDQAIADLVLDTAGDVLDRAQVRVVDIGCGAGLPRIIWKRLFASRPSGSLQYEGYDLSPGMIEAAKTTYALEIREGIATFEVADAVSVASELHDDVNDTSLALHGVLAHVGSEKLPGLIQDLARVTNGCVILSLFSRYADCRAPDHPQRVLHECRQLTAEPVWIHTYTLDEMKKMLESAGLRPRVIQGLGVRGGLPDVHGAFVARQAELQELQQKGVDVSESWTALRADIQAVIEEDERVGRKNPERGHDVIIVAET